MYNSEHANTDTTNGLFEANSCEKKEFYGNFYVLVQGRHSRTKTTRTKNWVTNPIFSHESPIRN